jgi:predicted amidohydrolase
MKLLLGELSPGVGTVRANLDRIRSALKGRSVDMAVFPELFLSGYRAGDRMSRLALGPGDEATRELAGIARETRCHLVVGGPVRLAGRPGEIANAALWMTPEGALATQVKRYLPSFGPFEEAHFFTPTDRSRPVRFGERRVGLAICYDSFFPEVFRELGLQGAELLVVISASPVTSGPLFAKILPARAIENAVPLLYSNRVGTEDGIVFGGGSGGWDARGEPLAFEARPFEGGAPEERILTGTVDLDEAPRWRPFRPVLRDRASRPGRSRHAPGPDGPGGEGSAAPSDAFQLEPAP